MPNYDVSSANLARVADQDVNLLRIANQDVWNPSPETYTIFNGASLDLSSHDDALDTAFIMNQFYLNSGSSLEVFEIGVYIPEGSLLLGMSGYVGLQFGTGFLKGTGYPVDESVSSKTPTDVPLAVGWNWYSLSEPRGWTEDLPYMLAGYVFGKYYVYDGAIVTDSAVPSTGGNFELVQQGQGDGFPERGWYTTSFSTTFISTGARSYGIDVRVRDA